MNAAHWDLQGHPAHAGPIPAMGAFGGIPGGLGVVEGGEIPYQPWALARKKENADKWLERDPAVKCYLPGVPRATYMPFPFQIVQSADHVLIGAARFLTAHSPTVRAAGQTFDIAARLHRGEALHGEDD